MVKLLRKTKKAIAIALTSGLFFSTVPSPVVASSEGWKKNNTGWWYQNADNSYPQNQWKNINGIWYYFNEKGYMLENDWAQDKSGNWYYLDSNGAMKSNGWVKDKSEKWYYVGTDGAMKTNCWEKDMVHGIMLEPMVP